jgi:hypothetical protein
MSIALSGVEDICHGGALNFAGRGPPITKRLRLWAARCEEVLRSTLDHISAGLAEEVCAGKAKSPPAGTVPVLHACDQAARGKSFLRCESDIC